MKGIFLPHREVYEGEFWGLTRTPSHEFEAGVHFHDFYEIQIFLEGNMELVYHDCIYPVHAGDIVLLRMFEPHDFRYRMHQSHQRFSICLEPAFLLSACTQTSNPLSLFEKCNKDYPLLHFSKEQFQNYVTPQSVKLIFGESP